jgi:Protein of unknown function (DUF1501)
MNISRRQALMTTLFGAGAVGLRSLATGLPAAFFLNPRKAMAAGCPDPSKAQYFVLATSAAGDPIGMNAPGTYVDDNPALAGFVHASPSDGSMAPTKVTMGGKTFTAALPWKSLPQDVLDRTLFWHMMTNTPIHPKEPDVLSLMGAAQRYEMLPSLLAKAVAPCLGTIQPQPLAIGAAGPPEALAYEGQTMPIIPPSALADTLVNPKGPLTQLQAIRDQSMVQIYELYKNGASPSQKAYIDQMVNTQQQARSLRQDLLGLLGSIKPGDNGVAAQILSAVTLIQMNVTPVVSIHIPFGGDNHSDAGLAKESAETVSGVGYIASLMAQLKAVPGLADKVTFLSLNVFGRTAGAKSADGRGHNQYLHTGITIGKPWKAGVVGAVAPVKGDYGCTAIDSKTGAGSATGDVSPVATLAAFGQTLLAAVGGDTTQISGGTVIAGALA